MTELYTDPRVIQAFRGFITRLPKGQDLELVLLKAHIMIEVELRLLIDNRLPNPSALKEANGLDCHQAIKLAKAFFPPGDEAHLWGVLEGLNKLRNDIAHRMIPRDALNDKIDAWVKNYAITENMGDTLEDRFGIALWSLFCWVSELVNPPVGHDKKSPADIGGAHIGQIED